MKWVYGCMCCIIHSESRKKTQNLRKCIKYNLYLDLTIHVSDLEMEVDTVEEPAAAYEDETSVQNMTED